MAADRDALRRWSQQHDGYDPDRSRVVGAWLDAMHCVATPMTAGGIPPTALTLAGVCAAAAAVRMADSSRPASLAAALVLATAVCDGLDGAVALQRSKFGLPTNRHGALVDHTADRITDVLFLAALERAGASRRAATAAALATVGYEGVRSARRRAGRPAPVVTVGERPFRVMVVCTALMAAPSTGAAIVFAMSTAAAAQVVRGWRADRL